MEKYAYPRLRGWPVKLVDSFSSRAGDVVVTTEYANDPWASYVPSADADAAVARSLLKQVRAIHRLGVAHNDLLLKNILFRKPRGVAIIDFEKSTRKRRGAAVGLMEPHRGALRAKIDARRRFLRAARARRARTRGCRQTRALERGREHRTTS